MNKYDLLEAMGGIREEYILDAADLKNDQTVLDSPLDNNHPGQPTQVHVNEQGTGQKKKGKIIRFRYWAATAAALLCLCVMLPRCRTPQRHRITQNLRIPQSLRIPQKGPMIPIPAQKILRS